MSLIQNREKPGYIRNFERTARYDIEDFDFIYSVLGLFEKHVVTPHILAELSNLSMKLWGKRLADYFRLFREVLEKTGEKYVNKENILHSDLLSTLGVTDLGIAEAAQKYKYLVFTDDGTATGYMRNEGIDVLNLNEVRTARYFGSS